MIGSAICAGQLVEVRIAIGRERGVRPVARWLREHPDDRLTPTDAPFGVTRWNELLLRAWAPSVGAAEDAVRSILCDCPVRVASVDVKPIDGGA